MLSLLESIGGFLFGWAIKAWQAYEAGKAPPIEVTEGEKAGAAIQQTKDVERSYDVVQKAGQGAAAVQPILDSPSRLQQYEATDPNNRDNA